MPRSECRCGSWGLKEADVKGVETIFFFPFCVMVVAHDLEMGSCLRFLVCQMTLKIPATGAGERWLRG